MDLADQCRDLFASLRCEAFGGRFHLPYAGAPPVLCAWSSAHHALVLRALDPKLAAEELQTLYEACQGESGLVRGRRAVDGDDPETAALIVPPVAAYAAALIVLGGEDGSRELLERATRELDAV